MRKRLIARMAMALVALLATGFAPPGVIETATAAGATPPGLKVAFFGDQGTNPAVLQLIRQEGAEAAVILGDFDYDDNPGQWDAQVSQVLGPDYPLFGVAGNHETGIWAQYRQKLVDRAARASGVDCSGDYGVNAVCTYKGLDLILSGAGTLGSGHGAFIREALAADTSPWRICAWHKVQNSMQVGAKGDEVGWQPYEECRSGGAIIATAHEHSYQRTRTLTSMRSQTVDPAWPDAGALRVGGGSTFAFVAGLGGRSITPQLRCLPATAPYGCRQEWASIYTSTQNANYGALFLTFNVDGNPNKARGYFKTVDGKVIDTFTVYSEADREPQPGDDPGGAPPPPSSGQAVTLEALVAAGKDDAYHTPNGFPNYSDSDGVVYAGARGSNGPQWGGWRWTGLNIPAGAAITDAYVVLTQEGWGDSVRTTLALERSPSASAFSSAASPSQRWSGRTGFEVAWEWPKGSPGAQVRTPSLAAGIQELVNAYGGLNSVAVLESGLGVPQGAYHAWVSYDSNPGLAARLILSYLPPGASGNPSPAPLPPPDPGGSPAPPPPSGGQAIIVQARVAAGRDDAYHTPNGFPNYSDSDGVVYAGARGSNGPQWGGWRWTGLNIPAGATITDAYVVLTQEGWGDRVRTTLALERSPSAPAFSSTASPSQRWSGRTGFEVAWEWPKGSPGAQVRTPSLAAGVQELVNAYGGLNSVVVLESGLGVAQGAYHAWVSYDSNPGLAATLVVVYALP